MSFSGVYYLAEMKFQLSKVEISTPVENLHIFSPLKVINLFFSCNALFSFLKVAKLCIFKEQKLTEKTMASNDQRFQSVL